MNGIARGTHRDQRPQFVLIDKDERFARLHQAGQAFGGAHHRLPIRAALKVDRRMDDRKRTTVPLRDCFAAEAIRPLDGGVAGEQQQVFARSTTPRADPAKSRRAGNR